MLETIQPQAPSLLSSADRPCEVGWTYYEGIMEDGDKMDRLVSTDPPSPVEEKVAL